MSTELDAQTVSSLAQVRQQLRINWYRCPIDRAQLCALSHRSDVRGLLQAGGHLGLVVATGILCWVLYLQQQCYGLLVALFLHGTITSFLTAPHHDLCHAAVFRTKWLNDLFLTVYSLLGWPQFPVYKFSHSYHHYFMLFPEGDRKEVMPARPALQMLYLLQLFTLIVFGSYQS